MKFHGSPVALMQNRMLGYNFRFIANPATRQLFMDTLKASVPLKMWDPGCLRWWVPDIYSSIIEGIAVDHGALIASDLATIRGFRAKYIDPGEPTLDSDFILLGVLPGTPYRIVEMAAAYWKTHLNGIPVSILELQAKEEAWSRIQQHFKQEAERPLPPALGPLGTPR